MNFFVRVDCPLKIDILPSKMDIIQIYSLNVYNQKYKNYIFFLNFFFPFRACIIRSVNLHKEENKCS